MSYIISMIKSRKLRTVTVRTRREAITATRILRGQGVKSAKWRKKKKRR